MGFIDVLLLAVILTAAVSVIIYMRRRRKKGECDSSGACEGCPMAGSCNDKKKQSGT